MADGFWSDDFDMDLLKIFPETQEMFGIPTILWALCKPTNGRINCPASWNGVGPQGELGTFVFAQHWTPRFERDENGWVSIGGCVTNDQWVRCTPLELARDEWVHGAHVVLCSELMEAPLARLPFESLQRDFQTIMYHLRGWSVDQSANDAARRRCLKTLNRIADKISDGSKKAWGVFEQSKTPALPAEPR